MSYKRVLTIQDISCVGQCSLTVALPIISVCGVETCILPSAVLSTHTGGFSGFTFRDLTDDIPKITEHWKKENISFDAVYTGYLGSIKQIDYVADIIDDSDAISIVDPVMGDKGTLYTGFDTDFVSAMKKLCEKADIIIPNITEACFMTGVAYKEEYDSTYIDTLLSELRKFCNGTIILTGVSYNDLSTGVVVYEKNKLSYYEHKKLAGSCHGTGDIYASAFTGALLNEQSITTAAKTAADFTLMCIENTDSSHWYGAQFEKVLPALAKMLK
ncbi:MAG: pyridoxamine kinase [Eubacteriales bacterium]|nr:pyridoxamine kinase [Eubacteriales bacterium]